MRIETQLDGKLRCYNFFPQDHSFKDLEMTFDNTSQMLIFAKNMYEKALRYEQDKIGNEMIIRVYETFRFPDQDGWKERLDELMNIEHTIGDLIEFFIYLKEKKEHQNAN